MVNDLLIECYMAFRVRHRVMSWVDALTFDKYLLSKVFDFDGQISQILVVARAVASGNCTDFDEPELTCLQKTLSIGAP